MRPFPNQVALELGQRSEHVENQLAGNTTGFYFLNDRFKGNPTCLHVIHDAHEVWHRLPQPVQAPDA